MFIAGSKTVQTATSNLITSMIYNPDKHAKMMKEIDPYMETIQDDIQNKMIVEDVDENNYVKMCFQESMRRYAPSALSSTSCMSKDITIQGVDMKKEEAFYIGIQFMQNDPKQWLTPDEFLPERFDFKDPLFKKPNGDKRHPLAYAPFLGGARVCLGKTFAEITMKFTIPLYYHFFEFELVDEAQKKD